MGGGEDTPNGTTTGTRVALVHTELPPCCLRVHPDNSLVVFVGTYRLESDGSRHGSVDVFRLGAGQLVLEDSLKCGSAILDLKFNPFDPNMLVSAHSTGSISVWKWSGSCLEHVKTLQLFDNDNLVTSVVFDPVRKGHLLATLTSGEAATVDLESSAVQILASAHALECWIGAYGELGELNNVVFTGGDDARMICHDLRTSSLVFSTTGRQHDAGVVSILPLSLAWNTSRPNQLFTGSYDDQLRLFDLRTMGNNQVLPGRPPALLNLENLGGGVWRLCPLDQSRLLVCCMYDGARVVSIADNSWEVASTFKAGHESICYGADWAGELAVTCSFYDRVVQVWEP